MACVMSPITGQVFSCQIPLPPEHFGLIDNDCVPVTLVEIQDLISLAESQHQWIDLVGHPREEDRSDAKVGMILFTEAHLEYNAGLVISIGSASRPSPIDPASTADTLFCTSADAMCAVCTGHHKKGGNSACLRGQQQSKGDRNPKQNKTKTPNTNQPNPPKQTSQSFALY